MHHITLIRKNLLTKFKNSSARNAYSKHIESINEYKKRALENTISVPDLFNLNNIALECLKELD